MADSEDWVNPSDLQALRMERQYLVGLEGSGPSQAMNILREASPAAAMQVVRLALHADSETVRLRASTYILDKTTGEGDGDKAPWDDLRDSVVKDLEAYLAEHGTRPPE